MKTLTIDTLVTVTGGAGKNDAVTQQLASLQTSITDLAANQPKSSGTDTTMMLMMALALRPQPQATIVAAPAAPVINIRARFRR